MWKRWNWFKFLCKRKHFEERSWKRKQTRKHLTFWEAGSGNVFHNTWGRDVEVEAVTFLWKLKHFEERSWKRKQKILYCFHIPCNCNLEFLDYCILLFFNQDVTYPDDKDTFCTHKSFISWSRKLRVISPDKQAVLLARDESFHINFWK